MATSIQSQNWCSIQPTLNHDLLITGTECPFCHSSGQTAHWPNTATAVIPATQPTQPAVIPTTQPMQPASAQYTPLAPGAVNAQLRASLLARGTGVAAATKYRSQAISQAQIKSTSLKVSAPFLFTVKVAWATYDNDTYPPTTSWQRFNEYTTVAITHNACISFSTMKETFRQQLQAQPAPYFTVITGPKARGHWTIASNHLTPTGTNMQPNVISN